MTQGEKTRERGVSEDITEKKEEKKMKAKLKMRIQIREWWSWSAGGEEGWLCRSEEMDHSMSKADNHLIFSISIISPLVCRISKAALNP